MLSAIWNHLNRSKNVKNAHGRLLLLFKLQASVCIFTQSNTLLHECFSRFFNCANGTKLCKTSRIIITNNNFTPQTTTITFSCNTTQKISFPLRISSVNVTKSAISCGLGNHDGFMIIMILGNHDGFRELKVLAKTLCFCHT